MLTIDNKIQIFYERITGWQLDIADKVINGIRDKDGVLTAQIVGSGFAALNIILSYFEMIGKYMDGFCDINKSQEYFVKGVESVFPELCKQSSWLPKKMYFNIRCGLYHHGMTEEDIILKGEGLPPITIVDGKFLIINPHTMVLELKNHFEYYMKQLKDDNNLKSNFEKRFDYDNT
jgi:hypothetical protein